MIDELLTAVETVRAEIDILDGNPSSCSHNPH